MVSASGWLVLSGASAGGTTEAAAAAAPEPVGIAAAIGADGAPTSAPGTWRSRRIDDGLYELSFPLEVTFAVRSWEQPAGVTIRPVAALTWLVSFDADGTPVDTAFTFLAVPAAP